MPQRKDLAETLQEDHAVQGEALERARREQERTSRPLWAVLLDLGLCTEEQIFRALHRRGAVTLIAEDRLAGLSVPAELLAALPRELSAELGVLPLERSADGKRVALAMVDPLSEVPRVRAALSRLGVTEVHRFLVHRAVLRRHLPAIYSRTATDRSALAHGRGDDLPLSDRPTGMVTLPEHESILRRRRKPGEPPGDLRPPRPPKGPSAEDQLLSPPVQPIPPLRGPITQPMSAVGVVPPPEDRPSTVQIDPQLAREIALLGDPPASGGSQQQSPLPQRETEPSQPPQSPQPAQPAQPAQPPQPSGSTAVRGSRGLQAPKVPAKVQSETQSRPPPPPGADRRPTIITSVPRQPRPKASGESGPFHSQSVPVVWRPPDPPPESPQSLPKRSGATLRGPSAPPQPAGIVPARISRPSAAPSQPAASADSNRNRSVKGTLITPAPQRPDGSRQSPPQQDREARSAAVIDREARSAAVIDREARSAAVIDREAPQRAPITQDPVALVLLLTVEALVRETERRLRRGSRGAPEQGGPIELGHVAERIARAAGLSARSAEEMSLLALLYALERLLMEEEGGQAQPLGGELGFAGRTAGGVGACLHNLQGVLQTLDQAAFGAGGAPQETALSLGKRVLPAAAQALELYHGGARGEALLGELHQRGVSRELAQLVLLGLPDAPAAPAAGAEEPEQAAWRDTPVTQPESVISPRRDTVVTMPREWVPPVSRDTVVSRVHSPPDRGARSAVAATDPDRTREVALPEERVAAERSDPEIAAEASDPEIEIEMAEISEVGLEVYQDGPERK